MAEQLLDRAQITATREQVRGERMAQRMRRRRVRQTEGAAQLLHAALDDAGLQFSAARATEEGEPAPR